MGMYQSSSMQKNGNQGLKVTHQADRIESIGVKVFEIRRYLDLEVKISCEEYSLGVLKAMNKQ